MVQTIGLVNRTIKIKHTTEKCTKCDGSGLITIGTTNASRIKGLKASGIISIQGECDCDNGHVPSIIKIIKKADRMKHMPIIINS